MDENKIKQEVVEKTKEENEEVIPETSTETVEEVTSETSTEIAEESKDNKFIRMIKSIVNDKKKLTISIVVMVLIIALLVIGVSFVAPKSFTGTWELTVNPEITQEATDDQIEDSDRVYYIFEKPDRYGKGEWSIFYAGSVEHYSYELMQEGSVNKINLGSADLEYKITGSKLLGNAKITLTYPEYTDESTGQTVEESVYIFEQARKPRYNKESYSDYETDDALIGEWVSNERTLEYYFYSLSYVQTVQFNKNGVMVIRYQSEDLGLDRYIYYAYTAKDGELTFSLVTDKETKYTVGYEFDKDSNLKFVDDTTTESLFADAFFGDFTFYTPENLPQPSQATADELLYTME